MSSPQKLAPWSWCARRLKAAVSLGAVLLPMLLIGCSSPIARLAGVEQVAQTPQPGDASIQPAAHQEPNRLAVQPGNGNQPEQKEEGRQPQFKLTLPMAVAMCVNQNFRVQAGAAKVRMAEGDRITSSLIPNPTLSADCQLIPLQRADIDNQLGPPQWDASVSIPVDWCLFGKRVAAMQAAQLGVEVSSADSANTLRIQVAQTVDAFYEVLEDDAYFKLAEKNLEELRELEKVTADLAKNNKAGPNEVDRIKLAVHEAILERHDRELALDLAKARLRPFLGRTAADPDYEVEGSLTVNAVLPPPKLEAAVALAEVNRPDLLAGRKSIDQANATVNLERRRARPTVNIEPGWSYQDQAHQTVFRNGSMFDIGISMSLPLTDRNQGNIHKAQAQVHERQSTYLGDRADALADVEASVASYADAVEHLQLYNTKETLKAADDLRKRMEMDYRAGNRRLIEMLDAQRAYRDRLGHVIEFESTYWRTLNRLNAAVGVMAYDPVKGPTEPLDKEK
jgi:cobalt-zinc-cadmium efflux system outer membrane protein